MLLFLLVMYILLGIILYIPTYGDLYLIIKGSLIRGDRFFTAKLIFNTLKNILFWPKIIFK